MRKIIFVFLLLSAFLPLHAQRITHTYNNVSLSDALRQLNGQTDDYTISFLYNELEDFRVTTAVHRKSVPDAIRQMIGFYPIRMEVNGSDIIVECVQKTATRYKGTVIDEQGAPLPYANIALLSPQDSTLITGGVSNESGLFVIPCDERSVVARISFVGYKTIYKHCHSTALGTLQMQPDNYALKEVTVKGARPLVKMVGDAFVTIVDGSYLSRTGTGHDVLAHIPGVLRDGNKIEVLGRGTPLIYINGRQMRDQGELDQLSSDQIKDVEVVMTPGAKYDASVKAVIRIKTLRPVGEGFSFDSKTLLGTNRSFFGQEEVNMNYRAGGLDLFAMMDFEDFRMKMTNTNQQDVYLQQHYTQQGITNYHHHTNIYYGKLGFNYMFDDNHSVGMTYSPASRPNKERNNFTTDTFTDDISDDHLTGDGHEKVKRTEHTINAYYSGTLGKWSLDANADMLFQNEVTDALTLEMAEKSDDRSVTTHSNAKNRLYAAKFVAAHPLWKGRIEMGMEGSYVHRTDAFANFENIITNSDTKTEETDGAVFAELTQQLGKLSAKFGLRYEHVDNRYYEQGMLQDTESRKYDDIFTSAMLSFPLGKAQARLSYARNINRPAFAQLTNNLTYINRYLYESGNPYLRPTYRDNLSLAVNWKWMMAMVDYAHIHDYIISAYSSYNDDPTVALLRKDNTSGFNNLQAMLHFAPNFGGYHPQLMLAVMWQDLKVQFQGKSKKMNDPMYVVRFNNAVNLPHDIWLNADFSWRSAGDSENIRMAGSWQFDISFYKSFFNDRLSLKLACEDVFASMRQKLNIYSDIHQFYLDKRLDNRKLKLTIRYNFNPAKSKYRGQGAGNDVKERL